MNRSEIKKQLDEIIQAYDKNGHIENYCGKSFITDLEMDSVSLMEAITDIEDRFKIIFGLDVNLIELFDNYDKLLEYLYKKMGVS